MFEKMLGEAALKFMERAHAKFTSDKDDAFSIDDTSHLVVIAENAATEIREYRNFIAKMPCKEFLTRSPSPPDCGQCLPCQCREINKRGEAKRKRKRGG